MDGTEGEGSRRRRQRHRPTSPRETPERRGTHVNGRGRALSQLSRKLDRNAKAGRLEEEAQVAAIVMGEAAPHQRREQLDRQRRAAVVAAVIVRH
ncbi:MAG: hypothetical protein ABI950_14030 [Solirubrobacteraceae bacterium]